MLIKKNSCKITYVKRIYFDINLENEMIPKYTVLAQIKNFQIYQKTKGYY